MTVVEAIEILKKLKNDKYTAMVIKDISRLKEQDEVYVLTPRERDAIDIILNLIRKQQKELNKYMEDK